MNKSTVKLVVASLSCLGIGAGIGYKVAERRLGTKFDERLVREIAEMQTYYTVDARKKYETPQDAVKELIPETSVDPLGRPEDNGQKVAYHKIVQTEGYLSSEKEEALVAEHGSVEVTEPDGTVRISGEVHNVFGPNNGITVISDDEFLAEEMNYVQSTLTYYELDGVLVDVHDDRIDDVEQHIGTEFRTMFGKKCDDENAVHVRNQRLQLEFEIVRSPGAYVVEVLGEDLPIETPRDRIRGV